MTNFKVLLIFCLVNSLGLATSRCASGFLTTKLFITGYVLLGVAPDPDFPGTFRIHLKSHHHTTPFEGVSIFSFVAIFPNWLNALGYRIERKKFSVSYPDILGLNARIIKLRRQNHPLAPSITFWEDKGKSGADDIDIIRHWGQAAVPLSYRGQRYQVSSYTWPNGFWRDTTITSLHVHDVFVHGIGYLLFPRLLVETSSSRSRLLSQLFDALPKNQPFRDWLLSKMVDEVAVLDLSSANLSDAFRDPKKNESERKVAIEEAIAELGYGDISLARAVRRYFRDHKGMFTEDEGQRLIALCSSTQFEDLTPRGIERLSETIILNVN